MKPYIPKVVYDCDDVLLALNETAHQLVGVDLYKRKYYDVRKEFAILTTSEMDAIIGAYNDVETFRKAHFYEGIDNILDVEKQGLAEVYIHSLSYKQEIRDYKYELLREKFPELPTERLCLECGNNKSAMDNLDILVEDSLDNIRKSKAKLGNIMIRKPYNRPWNYGTRLEELRAIEVEDLVQANMVVKLLLNGTITLR